MADCKKDVRQIIELCQQHGWRVRHGKHWIVYSPIAGKRPVFIGSTPSDHRALLNIRARLRRAGATFL